MRKVITMVKTHFLITSKGILLIVILVLLFALKGMGQYNTSVGIRVGGTTGIQVKHFYNRGMAASGILGAFGNGASLTGLIEKHQPIYNASGLQVFYGGGLHLAIYSDKGRRYGNFGREIDYRVNNDAGVGINGIVGLAYQFPEKIPVIISVDLKPFVEFGTGGHISAAPDPSVGIKFILK